VQGGDFGFSIKTEPLDIAGDVVSKSTERTASQ
jgi:hypothetical protein